MFGSNQSVLGAVLGLRVADSLGVGPGGWPGWSNCVRVSENARLCLYCFCLCHIARFLESNWFVWVTQMNHIPMHIDHDRNVDWVSTQVKDGHLEDLGITQLEKGWVGRDAGRGSNTNNESPQQHCLIKLGFSPATMFRRE